MSDSARPLVSCLCPTYGRATVLGEAVECFLRQDYTPRELIIVNDAPKPLAWKESAPPGAKVVVYNFADTFSSLGDKYRFACTLCDGEYISFWEDDDLRFPYYLTQNVEYLEAHPEYACIKQTLAWVLESRGGDWTFAGLKGNYYESAMVCRAQALRTIGFSPEPGKALLHVLEGFQKSGRYADVDFAPKHSHIFRWDISFLHGESCLDEKGLAAWRASNCDFGSGEIFARDVQPYYDFVEAYRESL